MTDAGLKDETSFEERFAGQIYIFENTIKSANTFLNLDDFWIDLNLQRCNNMLQMLENKDEFKEYTTDTKMQELMRSFKETIDKLENAKKDLKRDKELLKTSNR